MITTKAWVLHQAPEGGKEESLAERLREESFSFSDLTENEVLAEPVYGCWEGNMSHAIERDPIDICRQRREKNVVIGNAGVVRVLRVGSAVRTLKEGDLCMVFCNGIADDRGYPEKIYAYDAPGSVGLLARQTKLHQSQLIRVPEKSKLSLRQWAAFSLRYVTAWANWHAAHGCWRSLSNEASLPNVWGWGGGVTYAQLTLGAQLGCEATMISSDDSRISLIKSSQIQAVDRREFPNLSFDPDRYGSDSAFRQRYLESEERFLQIVNELTNEHGVAIFIDFIGLPVYRATLKALARPGVITTAGWKEGMLLTTLRAIECMRWHAHVHTHYARYDQALAAISFAEEKQWAPPLEERNYTWEEIPELAESFSRGEVSTFFPVFEVNPRSTN